MLTQQSHNIIIQTLFRININDWSSHRTVETTHLVHTTLPGSNVIQKADGTVQNGGKQGYEKHRTYRTM